MIHGSDLATDLMLAMRALQLTCPLPATGRWTTLQGPQAAATR